MRDETFFPSCREGRLNVNYPVSYIIPGYELPIRSEA